MHLKLALGLTSALALTAALAACGSKASSAPSGGTPTIGDCTITGKPHSISITPVTAGTLTVETALPALGWWNGTTPGSINGGYEYCMAGNLAYMAGLSKVAVKNVTSDQLVAGHTNDFDLALAEISDSPVRTKVVDFSPPYFDADIGVLVQSGSDVTQDNITTKTCAAYSHTTSVRFIRVRLSCANDRVYPDSQAMYQGLLSGHVDAGLVETASVLAAAQKSGGKLKVVGQYSTGKKYRAIYPKGSANEAALNRGISTMLRDGTLDGLSKQWLEPAFGGDPSSVPVWTIK
jgi:polar amino acid transport system substrate-binding protein